MLSVDGLRLRAELMVSGWTLEESSRKLVEKVTASVSVFSVKVVEHVEIDVEVARISAVADRCRRTCGFLQVIADVLSNGCTETQFSVAVHCKLRCTSTEFSTT